MGKNKLLQLELFFRPSKMVGASFVVICLLGIIAADLLSGCKTITPIEPIKTVSIEAEIGLASPTALPPTPQLTITPTAQPQPTATLPGLNSVVVISFDGAGASRVYDWMERGELTTFSFLASHGLQAEMQTIDPSLTAPSHASLATGCFPSQTGIVGNLFHNPSDSFYWYRSGFEQPLDNLDPVWVQASRAGLKTATLFFAGGSPFLPGQSADYTIAYGVRTAYSRQETVTLTPLSETWNEELPVSYSPILEGSWIIPKAGQVILIALDSQDDGREIYDMVLLSTERSLTTATSPLHVREWGKLMVDTAKKAGMYMLIQDVSKTGGNWQVKLYHTGVNYNSAAPRSLLEALNDHFGFFPAGADSYALEHGWISAEDDLFMIDRQAQWMAEVTAWIYSTYHPDLLFTWQEAFDAGGHSFYPRSPGQPGYDEAQVAVQNGYYLRAAQSADRALARMLQDIPLDQAVVMVVSDHGMAPVHTTVNINTVLEEADLLELDGKDYVVVEKTRAIAFSSGGAAHIYLNLEGHEKDGIIPPEDAQSLEDQIYDLLVSLRYPQTNELVFERIWRSEELSSLGLDHQVSGELFAQANPGFDLDSHRGRRQVFEPALYSGQHGYSSYLPELQAIFIAAGAGITGTGESVDSFRIIDIAPTLAALLHFQSSDCEGNDLIPELLP